MGGWWRCTLVSPDGVALSRMSVCLPLLIFLCTIKSRSPLLAPAHLGGPGKRAVKRLCVLVIVTKLTKKSYLGHMNWKFTTIAAE